MCKTLKVLQKLVLEHPEIGEDLVTYYRQLLPTMNLFVSKSSKISSRRKPRWQDGLWTTKEHESLRTYKRDTRNTRTFRRRRSLHQHKVHDSDLRVMHILIVLICILASYNSMEESRSVLLRVKTIDGTVLNLQINLEDRVLSLKRIIAEVRISLLTTENWNTNWKIENSFQRQTSSRSWKYRLLWA